MLLKKNKTFCPKQKVLTVTMFPLGNKLMIIEIIVKE